MKYILTLTALILAIACTKKTDTTTTEDTTTTQTESTETPMGTTDTTTTTTTETPMEATDTAAPAAAAAPGSVVHDKAHKAVKDENGKKVREEKSSSSQSAH